MQRDRHAATLSDLFTEKWQPERRLKKGRKKINFLIKPHL
jgi:hypothetical protein